MKVYDINHISMQEWADLVKEYANFNPQSIMDIGAMDGADTETLELNFKTGNVYIIEPHPILHSLICKNRPSFKSFNLAASNITSELEFNIVSTANSNLGISSLYDRTDNCSWAKPSQFEKILVKSMRMDEFMEAQLIDTIDLLKIDVEGHSFEVLQGFGERLTSIKCIHIENEHTEVWKNQKLYPEVEPILVNSGFVMLSIKVGWPQTDSIWIQKNCLK